MPCGSHPQGLVQGVTAEVGNPPVMPSTFGVALRRFAERLDEMGSPIGLRRPSPDGFANQTSHLPGARRVQRLRRGWPQPVRAPSQSRSFATR